jgi:hypothetical protein
LSERGLTLNLHAYQCHVFLDWRELRPTAQQPWDRLCDQLNGSGVPNLDDALVNLELRPVHDALREQLDPALVRIFAGLAEHPRSLATGNNKKIEAERLHFSHQAWTRCETFLRAAQTAYASRTIGAGQLEGAGHPANPETLAPIFRERLRAAMRIPAIEALFPAPWTVAARRVLPSASPHFTATAMWGPLLGWCALELLAESIDPENPGPVALDLFDRLRLREPFAQSFTALGFEGEEGWRVAARIKVVLLTAAGVGREGDPPAEPQPAPSAWPAAGEVDSGSALHRGTTSVVPQTQQEEGGALAPEAGLAGTSPMPEPPRADNGAASPASERTSNDNPPAADEKIALSPALWLDPDVRWLCGVHEAEGHVYLLREPYEELLWWLLMPSLLRLAGEPSPSRAAVAEMSKTVEEALATAEAAGYRVDLLLGVPGPAPSEPTAVVEEPPSPKEKPNPAEVHKS